MGKIIGKISEDGLLWDIRNVIDDYHDNLNNKQKGNLATLAMVRIEAILGMPWIEASPVAKEQRG